MQQLVLLWAILVHRAVDHKKTEFVGDETKVRGYHFLQRDHTSFPAEGPVTSVQNDVLPNERLAIRYEVPVYVLLHKLRRPTSHNIDLANRAYRPKPKIGMVREKHFAQN